MTSSLASEPSAKPWWAFGHVWLIIAGPAVVVVAGFLTFYLAVRSPDPVLPTQLSATANPDTAAASSGLSDVPAVQARNHAATGALPAPAEARQKP
jgi:hypothetical protein